MFRKLTHRVFRDPIHGYINIHEQVIWDCINSKEFQRLRRIKQLGASHQVYQTAEHSRFSHSLGVYEITRRMFEEVKGLADLVTNYDQTVTLLAALLHDLGHGPFSHTFESVSRIDHEKYTELIILGDTEINAILSAIDTRLPHQVASIINHSHPNKILTQLVSSQLDADRMDYLLRDAYFTGTSYGSFDLNRLIRTMRVSGERLVIKESGIHAVEDYIMARYHMYWNVYFHATSRAYEAVLYALFRRLADLKESDLLDKYPRLKTFLVEEVPRVESLLALDEAVMIYYFSEMQSSEDPILRDLSTRLLNRQLFAYEDIEDDVIEAEVIKMLEANNLDPRYYLAKDTLGQTPYHPYEKETSMLIYIIGRDQEVKELSEVSEIVAAISAGKEKKESKIFYPKIKKVGAYE